MAYANAADPCAGVLSDIQAIASYKSCRARWKVRGAAGVDARSLARSTCQAVTGTMRIGGAWLAEHRRRPTARRRRAAGVDARSLARSTCQTVIGDRGIGSARAADLSGKPRARGRRKLDARTMREMFRAHVSVFCWWTTEPSRKRSLCLVHIALQSKV